MYLTSFKQFAKRIDFKITIWHFALYIISFSILFIVFFLLYTESLKKSDHLTLESKYQVYSAIYNIGGTKSLDTYLQSKPPQTESTNFFVRVIDKNFKTIYFQSSRQPNFFELEEIEEHASNFGKENKWFYIKTLHLDHDLEILSAPLGNGNFLQVGKTTIDHNLLLERFKKTFGEIFILAIILGGMGGMFLSNKMLLPLRNLITTLKAIQFGNDEARAPETSTKDELHELTQLFNQMLDRIQTSNQGMRETLDTIAHELRTPLTSVRGMAEVALYKKHSTENEYREILEDCIEGIDEILGEFKMMTDITEVEAGLQSLNKEEINLHSICQDIADLYEFVAEQKEININLSERLEIVVLADRKKIQRVIANLIDNAIKYSPNKTSILISIYQKNGSGFIAIKDEGVGISDNDLPHIWKRLYRAKSSRSQKGIGLGLSLVKSIIDAHYGDAVVVRNEKQGSTFTIRLPLN